MIPASKLGVIEHIKRTVYYAGWINYPCVENLDLPDPSDLIEGEYRPTCYNRPENVSTTAELVAMICSCGTQKCANSPCAKVKNFECLPFCKNVNVVVCANLSKSNRVWRRESRTDWASILIFLDVSYKKRGVNVWKIWISVYIIGSLPSQIDKFLLSCIYNYSRFHRYVFRWFSLLWRHDT